MDIFFFSITLGIELEGKSISFFIILLFKLNPYKPGRG